MSPEQIRGEELDARSDIFSLGLVLYEMVAGRPAFAAPTPMAIAAAILHDEPRPLNEHRSGVPVGLQSIVGKTLAKDRALRYQSASELLADLAAGRIREAVAPLQRARDENPLMPARAIMFALALEMTGHPRQALDELDALLERGANEIASGTALLIAMGMKDTDEVSRRIAALKNTTSRRPLGIEDYLNDPAGAREAIIRLAPLDANQDAVSQSQLGTWAAYFGHHDLALDLMKKAVKMPTYNPGTTLLWRPVMRDVRKLPGFKDLVRDLGYLEYWRKYGWPDFCRQAGDDFVCE